MNWTGIRQDPMIREWSSNPEADECAARMFRARSEAERRHWARQMEGAERMAWERRQAGLRRGRA